MELVRILHDSNLLFTVRYQPDEKTAFDEIDDFWTDFEKLRSYIIAWRDRFHDYNGSFSPTPNEAAAQCLSDYRRYNQQLITTAAGRGDKSLDELFERLEKDQDPALVIAKYKGKPLKNPWLRIFAIRIDGGRYIITGGALKMSNRYEYFGPTNDELERQKTVIDFLEVQGIIDKNTFEQRVLSL